MHTQRFLGTQHQGTQAEPHCPSTQTSPYCCCICLHHLHRKCPQLIAHTIPIFALTLVSGSAFYNHTADQIQQAPQQICAQTPSGARARERASKLQPFPHKRLLAKFQWHNQHQQPDSQMDGMTSCNTHQALAHGIIITFCCPSHTKTGRFDSMGRGLTLWTTRHKPRAGTLHSHMDGVRVTAHTHACTMHTNP